MNLSPFLKLSNSIGISLGICTILTLYSYPDAFPQLTSIFVLICLGTSLLLCVWRKGSFKVRFLGSLPYAFLINGLAFVVGYFYVTIGVL